MGDIYTEIKDMYYDWMISLIGVEHASRYSKLIRYLDRIPFRYTMSMDENRMIDGIDLRYRFGYEHCIDRRIIAGTIGNIQCSFLEMMIALSLRCEENITYDPKMGDRLPQWFWEMISSLGLYNETDEYFDESKVRIILNNFYNHDYQR